MTNENLAYQGNVTINVLVTRASGAPLQGMTVNASGTGFSVSGTTSIDGTVSLANVPVGQVATVLATHPALSNRLRASAVVLVAPGLDQVTLALPAFGTVTGEVRRPNGTLAGAGVRMEASATSVQGSFTYTVNTNASQPLHARSDSGGAAVQRHFAAPDHDHQRLVPAADPRRSARVH